MGKRIALLRGINVGGRTSMPMARLRELCAGLGWGEVQTYIQSGNIVFDAEGASAVNPTSSSASRAIALEAPVRTWRKASRGLSF